MTMAIRMPWPTGPDPDDALELQPFDPAFRGEWAWEQPRRLSSRWRLTCDGAPVAALAVRALMFKHSRARFADGTWEVRHRFPFELVVGRAGETAAWGRYRPGWLVRGTVLRADGAPLLWRPDEFWMRRWSFATSEQLPLVHFRPRRTFLRHEAIVELEDAARRMPDLPQLLVLGWVLLLRRYRGQHGD